MKGPGIRLDLEVRREWECPHCGKRRRATGNIVALRCGCTRDKESMKLLEGQRQTRSFADVIERVQSASKSSEPQRPPEPEPAADDNPPSNGDAVSAAPQSPAADTETETVAKTDTPPPVEPEAPAADENS